MQEYTFTSAAIPAGLHVCHWDCGQPWAVLQIIHGMSEYIQRYDEFARFLNERGIAVMGCDNASHGKSRAPQDPWGYFGPQHGWDNLIADVHTVRQKAQELYPGLPMALMGHSMGSFLARSYAARLGTGISAFIFMGTAGPNPLLGAGKKLAEREIRRQGGKDSSHRLDKLVAGQYNATFRPNRTDFDWLSRDTKRVGAYIADPACGFPFTACGYRDLFQGLEEISRADWAEKVPDVPIFLLSGQDDPVGGKDAKGVRLVAKRLEKAGRQVTLRIYPHARHELLNELNREEVMEDILAFLNGALREA